VESAMMSKLSNFFAPNKVILGNGAVGQVGAEAAKLGGNRALIVTDPGVVKAGLLKAVQESLEAEKIAFEIFDGVEPEPPARVVDACVQQIHEGKHDIVIGIGGGSSMDVTKSAATVAMVGGKVLDYIGLEQLRGRGLPKVLIPTTAGTGSEVTKITVVTDEAENDKKVVNSEALLGNVAIVDPMLTLSMPPKVTADTGMDALVHATETYVSRSATPFSDILAIEAIRLISRNLPIAYREPGNREARFNMSLAATVAGMAFSSGGLGAVHALAYVLDTEYHLSHGRTNAVMFPYVVDFNKSASIAKYARIAKTMDDGLAGLSEQEAAGKLLGILKRLLETMGIPSRLADYGITGDVMPTLVAGGMKQRRLFAFNPRDLTEEDVKSIYTAAL
jgi:alcohol dehydrogenase class IV